MRALVPFLLLAACRPDFGLPVSVVTAPRILSVDLEPPEARPGDTLQLTAHPVSEDGALTAGVDFAYCNDPRPLAEPNVVPADCLGADGAVTSIAQGTLTTSTTLPLDGCLKFGPDTPAQKTGEPALRPRDPDVTGGYYQPVRLEMAPDIEAVALVRIRCELPNASAQSAQQYAAQYTNNKNPKMAALTLTSTGVGVDPMHVPAGTSVTLGVSWSKGEAETFLVHDESTDALVTHVESLRVSWFTTAGDIPIVTTGVAEGDTALETHSDWTTPAAGTSGTLWAVIRDSRGGSSVQSRAFVVP